MRLRGWAGRGRSASGSGWIRRARQIVKADRDRLPQVHGRLAGVRGNLDQSVAVGKIIAGEAVFLGAKYQGCACIGNMRGEDGDCLGKKQDGLVGFAMGASAGAGNERAVLQCFGEGRGLAGVREQFGRADGGACFAPVGLIGGDHGEAGKSEVGHGAGGRADVEGIARRNEDDVEPVALFGSEQEMIVEPPRSQVSPPRRRRLGYSG